MFMKSLQVKSHSRDTRKGRRHPGGEWLLRMFAGTTILTGCEYFSKGHYSIIP